MKPALEESRLPQAESRANGLPEGWLQTTLATVCEINPPKPPKDALPPDAPVTFVPMPAVDEEKGAITNPQSRPFAQVRKGYTAFRDDDVIMAKITPCMENGKAAIARGLTNGLGFGSTEFHVLRSRGAVLPEFVYYFIRQESFRRDAESEMTGSVGQKRVPQAFLGTAEFPLPPLVEQKRIVAKVEELLARVSAARERLQRVPALLKRFRQAILAAACSGRLTADWREGNSFAPVEVQPIENGNLPSLPESWVWTCVAHVAEVQGGIQKQPIRTPRNNAFPYLRVANVQRNKLDLSEIKHMELFPGELETYRLQRGDLLIVEGNGSIDQIGRSALWTDEIKDCVHQNHIIRVRATKMLPEFLNMYWNSPFGIERVIEAAVTTAGLYSLSTKKIASLPTPDPPPEEQNEIVRRVEALFKLADAIEKRLAAATTRADKLTQAILAKAFRGELVPTEAELARRENRPYEPTSAPRQIASGQVQETQSHPGGQRSRKGEAPK